MTFDLQANDYNVEITTKGIGEASVDTMGLTLLSTQLAHDNVTKYRAPSLYGHDQI